MKDRLKNIFHLPNVWITGIGLVVSIIALGFAVCEIRETTKVRKATLLASVLEQIEVAQEKDKSMDATTIRETSEGDVVHCSGKNEQLSHRSHIPLFEHLVEVFERELPHFVAPNTNFIFRSDLRRYEREYGINLAKTNLESADFSGSNLKKANFEGAQLADIRLKDACLEGANFSNADLRGSQIWAADISNAVLFGSDFTNADLTGANLSSTKFDEKTNLRDANLTEATLIIRGKNFYQHKNNWIAHVLILENRHMWRLTV